MLQAVLQAAPPSTCQILGKGTPPIFPDAPPSLTRSGVEELDVWGGEDLGQEGGGHQGGMLDHHKVALSLRQGGGL